MSAIGSALFGNTRQSVLRLFLGSPDRRFYLREIIRTLNLGSGAVQREVQQLSQAQILTRTVEGVQTYYQANHRCPVFEELRGMVRKTFGIVDVLSEALVAIAPRIQIAFIYGSVASGTERSGSDIDVMVVGDRLSLMDVTSAFAGAQSELNREINPSVYTVEEFCRRLATGDHFISQVVNTGSKLFLIGDHGDIARLAKLRVAAGPPKLKAGDRRTVRRRR